MRNSIIKAEEFAALKPRTRGFVVQMFGKDRAQPHVPDETNPYRSSSPEYDEYEAGRRQAERQGNRTV